MLTTKRNQPKTSLLPNMLRQKSSPFTLKGNQKEVAETMWVCLKIGGPKNGSRRIPGTKGSCPQTRTRRKKTPGGSGGGGVGRPSLFYIAVGNDHFCDATKRASQRLIPKGAFPCITEVVG